METETRIFASYFALGEGHKHNNRIMSKLLKIEQLKTVFFIATTPPIKAIRNPPSTYCLKKEPKVS